VFATDSLSNDFMHDSDLNDSNYKLLQQHSLVCELYISEGFHTIDNFLCLTTISNFSPTSWLVLHNKKLQSLAKNAISTLINE